MEEKKPAQPEVSTPAQEKPGAAQGCAEPPQAGFGALPDNAPPEAQQALIEPMIRAREGAITARELADIVRGLPVLGR